MVVFFTDHDSMGMGTLGLAPAVRLLFSNARELARWSRVDARACERERERTIERAVERAVVVVGM